MGTHADEATILLRLGEREEGGCVPMRIVNKDVGVVTATLVGENARGEILVRFPVTNCGSMKFVATESELDAIALDVPYVEV